MKNLRQWVVEADIEAKRLAQVLAKSGVRADVSDPLGALDSAEKAVPPDVLAAVHSAAKFLGVSHDTFYRATGFFAFVTHHCQQELMADEKR